MTTFENLFYATAQAQTQTPSSGADKQQGPLGSLGMFLPMILVFVIFYFLMIRPQQKQRKKQQEMVNNLKKGDEVVTSAGIHARVHGITDNVVTLEIADNVRIKMDKQQVALVKTQAAA